MPTPSIKCAIQVVDLDALTRRETAFRSFSEITTGTDPDYFPTLRGPGTEALANAYDAAMQARGDARRAWRGVSTVPISTAV